jgi:trimeric autotransporter adhesin
MRLEGEPQLQMTHRQGGGKMRELKVRLAVCFALVFASIWGAGCAKQASAASPGCSGSCGTSPTAQAPSTSATANNDAALKGDYAFSLSGITGNGSVSSISAAVGRFTADGAGNLTGGEIDTNGVGTGALTAQSFTGTYTIGADNRGVMTWNLAGGSAKFAFAMTSNGNARFIEFDATGGSGTIGSGTIESADTSAFSTASISGDYAFGVAGLDNVNNRAAIIGRFTSNGTGALTGAAGDLNAYGTPYALSFSGANYTVSDTKTGRGTMNLAFTFGGAPANLNFVFYIVNGKKLVAMDRDTVTTSTPLLNGVVVQQQTPAGGFSNASLNGNMVIYLTGLSNCGSGAMGVPKAVAGLMTAGGTGALNLDFDENYCRAPRTVTGFAGTYSVASNGRTTIALGGYALVAYLASLDQAFLFVSDNNVLFGFGEPQAAGSFTNGAVKGTYGGSVTYPASFGVTVFSGEFTADGATATGSITGHEDIGAPSGPVSGTALNAGYSVSSSPTNGRGTMTVSSGTGGNAVIYVISPTKFVALSQNDPNPAILVFEQPSTTGTPPPPTITLSSITLSPTTVVGGAQSSTGTVTLSGPAPAGGAPVALASDNAAAGVPSSVTVPTGATSATFTVTTSAVATPTSANISASYGGASKSATLTVTPAPLPTVASLTLNPAGVIGGLQSSTGTVTLSGPAPAGGAPVALASDSAAAGVPSSVTVPTGATSATFTVNTSIVIVATSANISASYNSTTRTATLSVLI